MQMDPGRANNKILDENWGSNAPKPVFCYLFTLNLINLFEANLVLVAF